MHGYMLKLGNPFLTQWQRRYFYLFPNRVEWRGEGDTRVSGHPRVGRGAGCFCSLCLCRCLSLPLSLSLSLPLSLPRCKSEPSWLRFDIGFLSQQFDYLDTLNTTRIPHDTIRYDTQYVLHYIY